MTVLVAQQSRVVGKSWAHFCSVLGDIGVDLERPGEVVWKSAHSDIHTCSFLALVDYGFFFYADVFRGERENYSDLGE